MIERFLRRLSVRQRLYVELLILVAVVLVSLALIVSDRNSFLTRFQQFIERDAQSDRLLLSASTRVAISRINLLRYTQDVVPSPYETLDDINQAQLLLEQARALLVKNAAGGSDIDLIIAALDEYSTLVADIQAAQLLGDAQQVTRLEAQAQRLGYDIGNRIELIVQQSQARIAATNTAIRGESQRRLTMLIVAYALVIVVAGVLGLLIERSITRSVAELRAGANAFSAGRLDETIPVTGADELSVLAATFNQMAAQLAASYRDFEQRLVERTVDLERRTTYLRAVVELSQAATQILDVNDLMRQSVEAIRERFNLYYVGLFLRDESGEWAILQAGTGAAGQAMLARGHRIQVGSGMIGWAIAQAEARVAQEADADYVRKPNPELPDTRAEAAIPLRVRDQVIGALTIQDDEPDAFDEISVALLQTMADQLAVALDNARLFAERDQALQAARRAYGEIAQDAWRELMQERAVWGYIAEAQQRSEIASGAWPPDMLQAARDDQHVLSSDANALAVPVKARGQVIGVVQLSKPVTGGAWSRREVELIGSMIEQLGLALESARLYQDTQRRAAQERLVGEVGGIIRQSLDVDTVLQVAARELRRALEGQSVEVRLGVVEDAASAGQFQEV